MCPCIHTHTHADISGLELYWHSLEMLQAQYQTLTIKQLLQWSDLWPFAGGGPCLQFVNMQHLWSTIKQRAIKQGMPVTGWQWWGLGDKLERSQVQVLSGLLIKNHSPILFLPPPPHCNETFQDYISKVWRTCPLHFYRQSNIKALILVLQCSQWPPKLFRNFQW